MYIQVGKYYRTRDGRKVGPMRYNDGNNYWPWIDGTPGEKGFAWRPDGRGCICTPQSEYDPSLDLMAEWTEAPKLWREMTPEEKGALLLADHDGKEMQSWLHDDRWEEKRNGSPYHDRKAYRVKPAPREWWINPSLNHPRISDCEPSKPHAYIRVREVLP